MANWPLADGPTLLIASTHETAGSTTGPVTITASGTAHTKGAWTELFSSTDTPATLLILYISDSFTSNTNSSSLLDIGVGASGSEVVVAANLGVGFSGPRANGQGRRIDLPLTLKAGSRVAVRMQSVTSSRTCQVSANLFGGYPLVGINPPSAIDTYGANTAASRGVAITSGGSVNTKGSWTEITSATSFPMRAMLVSVQGGGLGSFGGREHLVDIGVGASGSETVLFPNIYWHDSTSEYIPDLIPAALIPLALQIPAGTRISARHQSTGTSDATADVIILGIR